MTTGGAWSQAMLTEALLCLLQSWLGSRVSCGSPVIDYGGRKGPLSWAGCQEQGCTRGLVLLALGEVVA